MDVPTVLASAALSAVVSAVVALSLTTYRAGREARAARRVRAREAIESKARIMRTDLRTYRARFAASLHRDAAVSWMDDYVKASAILHLADDLGAIRASSVRRHCRIIFGAYWCDIVAIERADPSSLGSQIAMPFAVAAKAGSGPPRGLDGLMHRAYAEPPGHKLQARLDRHLALLARAL